MRTASVHVCMLKHSCKNILNTNFFVATPTVRLEFDACAHADVNAYLMSSFRARARLSAPFTFCEHQRTHLHMHNRRTPTAQFLALLAPTGSALRAGPKPMFTASP